MSFDLNNAVALITGGSRGIGLSLAHVLARHGTKVAITGRMQATIDSAVKELDAAGAQVSGFVADAGDPSLIQSVVEDVERQLGHINILNNNAGISGPEVISDPAVAEEWQTTVAINLIGPMMYTHAVLPGMLDQNQGCIINIGSYAGVRPGTEAIAYSTSKAALARFSDSLAPVVADRGINIFTVSPGLVRTDMTRDVPIFRDLPDDAWSDISEIGRLVVDLLTKDVSLLSGRFIHVTDDLDKLMAAADKICEEELYTLRLPTLDGLA